MSSLLRIPLRAPRAHLFTYSTRLAPRRFASGDYGSKQSGHEQGINEDNPKKHLEHPGPESPVAKGQSQQSSDSKDGASPAIHQPSSPAENEDPEVKKHNEEMKNRAEKSTNQLSEDDNKVDKKFWKGDVGDTKEK